MVQLSDDEITAGLAGLAGWRREGDAIVKDYKLKSFTEAIAFVNRIAERAEAANHHPELRNVYNRVTVALSTHDAGGITQKDLDLAGEVEACAPPG